MQTISKQKVERTTIEYVAYSRLILSPLNVRKKAPTGIEALAETLAEKGILQNLVTHEVKGRSKQPKLGVCAGQRRLAALDLLFAQGRITKDYQVPVLIVSEGEAVAASLIENREREDMCLPDEALAFRLLAEEGKSPAHIASLFRMPEVAVRRVLKIANLAPALLDLMREDALDYEQAKVLALADDHATQERVWNEAPNAWQRRPSELRAAITQTELDARDNALAKFVGLDAYEAAGGYVRRDLFSDDQNAGYIADPDLLHRLATDRLIELSQAVAAEGWLFVETRTRGDVMEMMRYGRLPSTSRKPTKLEKTELAALVAVRDAAQAELDAYYDEDGEEDEARYERLDAAVTAAAYAVDQYGERFESFDADDMKQAGAFVYLDEDGQVNIERGLVRPDDTPVAPGGDVRAVNATAGRGKPPKDKPLHGEKLCRRLTAHRTAAVQAELIRQPNAALAVLMVRLIPVVFDDIYGRQYADHAIRIDVHTSRDALVSNADDMAESVAWKALEGERAKWARMLPKRTDQLLAWLLQQDADVTSNLFAFCVAATLDGISGADRAHPINAPADVLNVDLAYYWQPTRSSYFDHVSKARIEDVVSEAVSPEAAADLRGMKKGDAAAAAELRLSESGWLPEVLRNRDVPEHRVYGYDHAEDDAEDDGEGGTDDETEADVTSEATEDEAEHA
ncbi:ParB family chromosome partitioning protein [Paraburkholderia sp. BL23I1N1]|uniref:ParB/RepB/Spo0J family partition protein n=1 Tax=Paraburkholderia sp. BL23I1N1 TaxID=1938802 RepID=UPI000E72A226|nr:ParB/RepB/Spo0J family partition protein [Paraburkholderia sp. BL23I1N1]RKE23734.1 ParB family chromosome partitioning protein [Paraburkholderia sp. BL23I1N1]